MNDMAVSSLMQQINALSQRVNADQLIDNISTPAIFESENQDSFSNLMSNALQEINKQQKMSSEMGTQYQLGNKDIDTAELMIQIQKARVSFEALNQFRNQAVSAYQDIMNMQV